MIKKFFEYMKYGFQDVYIGEEEKECPILEALGFFTGAILPIVILVFLTITVLNFFKQELVWTIYCYLNWVFGLVSDL